MNFNQQAVGVKLQTVIGTAVPPVFTTDAVRIADMSASPLLFDDVAAPEISAALDAPRSLPYNERGEFTVTVNAFASGTAGTAPPWKALMRMASFAETITASVRAEYTLVNSGFERYTVDHHVDALRHRFVDCVSNFAWNLNAGSVPQFVFAAKGQRAMPADTAFPSPVTLTTWLTPKVVSKANTTATLDGFAACISQFSGDIGNAVTTFDRINCNTTELTARAKTGSITFEMTTVATKDWFSRALLGTPIAITVNHGSGAGNVLKIAIPDMVLKAPSYSNDNGILMVTANFEYRGLTITSE